MKYIVRQEDYYEMAIEANSQEEAIEKASDMDLAQEKNTFVGQNFSAWIEPEVVL